MADYKKMYIELFRATETAIQVLIESQNKCEDMYELSKVNGVTIIEIQRDNKE